MRSELRGAPVVGPGAGPQHRGGPPGGRGAPAPQAVEVPARELRLEAGVTRRVPAIPPRGEINRYQKLIPPMSW